MRRVGGFSVVDPSVAAHDPRVRVSNDKLPGTQDRAVTIWGTDAQTQQVIAMINNIISQPDTRPPKPVAAPAAPQ